jgi:hypothetical protein
VFCAIAGRGAIIAVIATNAIHAEPLELIQLSPQQRIATARDSASSILHLNAPKRQCHWDEIPHTSRSPILRLVGMAKMGAEKYYPVVTNDL